MPLPRQPMTFSPGGAGGTPGVRPGELRQRRRATLPVLAGIGGMTVPVVIFLALNPYLSLVAVATVAELLG